MAKVSGKSTKKRASSAVKSTASETPSFDIKCTDKTCVRVSFYKGGDSTFLDFRTFYLDAKTDEWKPTKKGSMMPSKKMKLLIKKLTQLMKDADEEGIQTSKD